MSPFSSIRVVDLTHVIAGPFCTYQLAIMGAEVIRIESPSSPDMLRACGEQFPDGAFGMGNTFVSQAGNKRAISVDIKTPEGQGIVKRLIEGADILVENYRTGAMADLGLDYASVKEIQPDIIYCSLTGFGQDGPLAGRTAYDNVIQAFSGLMNATGTADSGPVKVGPPVLDYGTGIQAAYAIAAALFQRTRTGQGQHIDIAMLDAALMMMSSDITTYFDEGSVSPRTGNMSAISAGYGCYATDDGLIMIGAFTGLQVCNLWKVLGDPAYGEKFAAMQPPGLKASRVEDSQRIAKLLLSKPARQWEILLNDAHVPAARVRSLDETLSEAHLKYRTVLQSPTSEKSNDQTQKESALYPVAAFKYADGSGPALHSAPAALSRDTREVMLELGYNAEQITQLSERNIIGIA